MCIRDRTYAAYMFAVEGTVGVSEYIYHRSDDDTYMRFQSDRWTLACGGVTMIDAVEGASDYINMPAGDLYVSGATAATAIGGTSATETLTVNVTKSGGTIGNAGGIKVQTANSSLYPSFFFENSNSKWSRFFMDRGGYGNCTYFDAAIDFRIRVNADASLFTTAFYASSSAEVYLPEVYSDTVTSARDLYIQSDGKIGYVSSSIKHKKNVQDISDVSWLYNLRPVEFDYRVDNSHAFGLIAEEVDSIQRMLVSHDNAGRPETVEYSRLIIPLLKAVQNLRLQVEALAQ